MLGIKAKCLAWKSLENLKMLGIKAKCLACHSK